jgi:hypothetical protein
MPYLDAAWVQVQSCWIMLQQMWRILRKTNPSSRRKGDPIFKHINGLRTNENLVMGPYRARNQERLCWRRPAAINSYAMLWYFFPQLLVYFLVVIDHFPSDTLLDVLTLGYYNFIYDYIHFSPTILLSVLRYVASSHISNTLLRLKLQGCYGRHSNGISWVCVWRKFVKSVPNPIFQYKRNQWSSKIYDPIDGVSLVNERHLMSSILHTYRLTGRRSLCTEYDEVDQEAAKSLMLEGCTASM